MIGMMNISAQHINTVAENTGWALSTTYHQSGA